ncbi:MAG TPA: hypothetical protein VF521_01095 [Pyrinomonadaceae bacterium]
MSTPAEVTRRWERCPHCGGGRERIEVVDVGVAFANGLGDFHRCGSEEPEVQIEPVVEFVQAVALVDRLIGSMNALPCAWEDFTGDDVAEAVKTFMRRHSEKWRQYE